MRQLKNSSVENLTKLLCSNTKNLTIQTLNRVLEIHQNEAKITIFTSTISPKSKWGITNP